MDYDLIHSNSVIEHVGRWKDIRDMARHIEQGAKPYFVQTLKFLVSNGAPLSHLVLSLAAAKRSRRDAN